MRAIMPAAPKPATSKPQALESVYRQLRELFQEHAPPFKLCTGQVRGKSDAHLVAPQPVVIPGSYGGKPRPVTMASLILQKGYVGFHYVPVYMEPRLRAELSPKLVKLLKGKSCFHITKLDEGLRKDVEHALEQGRKYFQGRGWM